MKKIIKKLDLQIIGCILYYLVALALCTKLGIY